MDRQAGQAVRTPASPLGWCEGALHMAYLTDQGLVRKSNQDGVFAASAEQARGPLGLLAAVADGMGGHQGGEKASTALIEGLKGFYDACKPATLVEDLKKLVLDVNRGIYRMGRADPDISGMGTTLTALVLREARRILVLQVGDSRAYRRHEGRLIQITQDHSFVADEVRKGNLTPEEALNHPKRNVITRAVGTRPFLDLDLHEVDLEMGDDVILCSDGLHGFATEAAIAAVLAEELPVRTTVSRLLDLAYQGGGGDNVGIVLIRLRPAVPWWKRLLGLGSGC